MNPSNPFNRLRTFRPVVACALLHHTTRLRKFIAEDGDKVDLAVVRKQTRLGKPLGDRRFLEMISKKLGYKSNFRSKGRPKRADEQYPSAL